MPPGASSPPPRPPSSRRSRRSAAAVLAAAILPGAALAQGGALFRDGFEQPASACAPPQHFAAGLQPSSLIHVAVAGSDVSGDGSTGDPYATIERALEDATPGSAVVVHAGTYAGGMFAAAVRGTAQAPIWIGGAAGESRPLIQGGSNALQLSRPAYVVLHDLEIASASANGINIDDGSEYADALAAHHVVVERLLIRDIGNTGNQDCLKISGLNDFWVLDSSFSRCGDGGSGIDFVGSHRGIVYGNRFSDPGSSGVQTKGGSEDIEIRANRFEYGGLRALNLGGSTGFAFFRPPLSSSAPNFEARDIRAIGNLFVDGPQTSLAFVGCVECVAVNNTVVNPGRWLVRILQETVTQGGFSFEPARDGLVQNTLFYFARAQVTGAEINVGGNTDAASFVWRNNLFYAYDAPAQSAVTPPGTVVGSIAGLAPMIAAPDYTIGAPSPAAGAGVAYAPGLADLGGRCFASPPSVGAWEVP